MMGAMDGGEAVVCEADMAFIHVAKLGELKLKGFIEFEC